MAGGDKGGGRPQDKRLLTLTLLTLLVLVFLFISFQLGRQSLSPPDSASLHHLSSPDPDVLYASSPDGSLTPRVMVFEGTDESFPQETLIVSLLPSDEMVTEVFWHDGSKGVARVTFDPKSSIFEFGVPEGEPHRSRVIMRIGDGLVDYAGYVPDGDLDYSFPPNGMSKPTEIKYAVFDQVIEPDVLNGAVALWKNGSDHWLIWDSDNLQKKVRFT